jgi:hypothetical protein
LIRPPGLETSPVRLVNQAGSDHELYVDSDDEDSGS